jgi:hypothetical protein
MIVKEQFPRLWNSPLLWNGPYWDRVCLEGHLHRQVDKGHPSVIRFLGDHVNRILRLIRIYTTYAELGDLATLVSNHANTYQAVDQQGIPLNANITRIPVVVVVYLCEAMAASVCLMAHGQLPDDQGQWAPDFGDGDGPNPPWEHNIIHRDIKPANYFLTECRDPTNWRGLPIAAQGDYGNEFDARNQWWINHQQEQYGMGTPGYSAPEQEVTNNQPVTSATNVFQVGLVMIELMTLSMPMLPPTLQRPDRPFFPNIDTNFYPAELSVIASECVQSNIRNRPSPKELYLRLRRLANGTANDGTPWGKLT